MDQRVHVKLFKRHILAVDFANHFPAFSVRQRHLDQPVQPSWPEYCRIENIYPVCAANNLDHAKVLEPVNFSKQLDECPFCRGRNCLREQGFSSPGFAVQQNSLWRLYPYFFEKLRLFQGQLNDLLDFLNLGFEAAYLTPSNFRALNYHKFVNIEQLCAWNLFQDCQVFLLDQNSVPYFQV